MKYEVTIDEIWTKTISVEASSVAEAEAKARAQYQDETGGVDCEGIAFDVDAKKTGMKVGKVVKTE
jgi:hypothetical protein